MTDKKRGGKTKYSLPQRWRSTAAALLVLFALSVFIKSKQIELHHSRQRVG